MALTISANATVRPAAIATGQKKGQSIKIKVKFWLAGDRTGSARHSYFEWF
jgi:hypothetical protein